MRSLFRFALFCGFSTIATAVPVNDNWADRIVIPLASLTAGFVDTQAEIMDATTEATDPPLVCKSGDPAQRGNTVWYGLTTGASPIYLKLSGGTGYDHVIEVLAGTPGDFRIIEGGCNDDGAASFGAVIDGLKLQPNTSYSILVARPAPNVNPATLSFRAELAMVRTVNKTMDTNDGSCTAADCSLREAILAGGGAVELPAGDYALSIVGAGTNNDGANGDIDVINKGVYIYGAGAAQTRILPGGAFSDRLFDLDPGATTFGGTFGVFDLTIQGGRAVAGGCINMAADGVAGTPNEYLVVSRSVISGCTTFAGAGGAIRNPGSPMLVVDSTIKDSTATSGGGGISYGQLGSNLNVTATILRSTLSNNASTSGFSNGGGGIETQGNLLMLASTVYGNRANFNGGGVLVTTTSGRMTLIDSTLAGNRADADANGSGAGGGLRIDSSVNNAYTMTNTVLANNLANASNDDCQANTSASILGAGNWVQTNANCVFTITASQTLNTNAQLGLLANNGGPTETAAPLTGSPLIDGAASGVNCLSFDQRGRPRPQDGDGNGSVTCDRGAVEVAPTVTELFFANGFE
jgi:CSLREA domain-containing protein